MQQAGESSVEEILESIKKVIARDNRASSAEQRRQRETRGLERGANEAGGRAGGDEAGAARSELHAPAIGMGEAARGPEDVLDLTDAEPFLDPADEADDMTAQDHDTPDEDEPLVTAGARASMRESLAALAMLAEPRALPQIVRSGETSLEGLTRELLRPALAEWLDKNLPALVERLVATEIARIVGKKG